MRSQILRLGRNSILYGGGQVITRLISLLLLPVFTSYLTPADYGVASILGVLGFFISSLAGLGIGAAIGIVYFEGGDSKRKQATIWSSFLVLAVSAGFLVVLAALFGNQIGELLFDYPGYDYRYLIAVSVTTTGLGVVGQPLMVYLQLEERVKAFVAVSVCSTLGTIGFSLLFVVGLGRGIDGYIEAALIGQGLALGLALIAPVVSLPFTASVAVAGMLLRLGLPLVPSFVLVFAMQQANKLILQSQAGLDAVGIYTIGFNMGLFLSLAVGGFTNAWYPFFMSFIDRRPEAAPLFGRILSYYLLSIGSTSLLFYLAARPAVLILTQDAFQDAYLAVGPSATAQVLIGLHSILLAGMYFAKEVTYQTLIQAAATIVAIGASLALIPILGILGASLALVAGFAAMDVLQHLWNRRRAYLAVEYDGRRVRRFVTLYAAFAAVFLFPREAPLAVELVASATAGVLWVGCIWALLDTTERQALTTGLRRIRARGSPARFDG